MTDDNISKVRAAIRAAKTDGNAIVHIEPNKHTTTVRVTYDGVPDLTVSELVKNHGFLLSARESTGPGVFNVA